MKLKMTIMSARLAQVSLKRILDADTEPHGLLSCVAHDFTHTHMPILQNQVRRNEGTVRAAHPLAERSEIISRIDLLHHPSRGIASLNPEAKSDS